MVMTHVENGKNSDGVKVWASVTRCQENMRVAQNLMLQISLDEETEL